MLAKEVLKNARYTLSDTAKQRWTDERLLAILNDGLLDIAMRTTIFVENVIVVLTNTVVEIDLSEIATKIVRVEYLDEPVPFMSIDEMYAKFGSRWQTEEGDKLKALVYDKQPRGVVRTYPIVKNAINNNIEYNSLFGIVTDISYSDILPQMFDHYGDISGIPQEALAKVYYIRRHYKVADIDDVLEIDDICLSPLQHYVAARALRDNTDTQNRAVAAEEMSMYNVLIEEYNIEKSKNFVRTPRNTNYRPMG